MSRDTSQYGSYYWCIKVTNDIAEDGEIYIMANSCRVLPNGELVCLGNRNKEFQDERVINLALAPGKWNAVYAASIVDGSPVAVDHWKGWIVQPT